MIKIDGEKDGTLGHLTVTYPLYGVDFADLFSEISNHSWHMSDGRTFDNGLIGAC